MINTNGLERLYDFESGPWFRLLPLLVHVSNALLSSWQSALSGLLDTQK